MISLGAHPEVTLANARLERDLARTMLREGRDPSAERHTGRLAAMESSANTFEAIATEWLHLQKSRLAAATYSKNEWMFGLANPHIGKVPVRNLTPPIVLACLRTIERGEIDPGTGERVARHETAHRTRSLIGRVCRYAISCGKAESDPTASLRGALAPVVSTPRAAITDPASIGALLRAIDGYGGQFPTRCALRLAPLLFVRPGELRAAEWSEVDFDAAEWRIPAARMKMRDEHIVPLCDQAVTVLRELHQVTGSGRYVFPSAWSAKRSMSENTVNSALRRLGFDSKTMTGHGFRALASTRLNEMGWVPDVIERQLAHAERNKVRAVYNRAQYLPERRKMMQAWADYLDQLRAGAGSVVAFQRKSA
jgi:integrase